MQLGRLTRLGRTELEEEMAKLREHDRRARGDPRLTDEKLRTVIKDRARRDPREVRHRPRRSKITFDTGDIDIEDLIDDEDLDRHAVGQGLRQDDAGRHVPHAGSRRAWRRRREAARRGLRHPHPHHDRARVPAVLLEPRPRVPAEGARDPDEGAHRSGHGHREPAAAAAGRDASRRSSTRATTRRTATCSSPPSRAR